MDRKTVIAIVLCLLTLLLYPQLLKVLGLERHLRPPVQTPVAIVDSTVSSPGPVAAAPSPGGSSTLSTPPPVSPAGSVRAGTSVLRLGAPALERSIQIETPLYLATFSSRGARLVSVELKAYTAADGASKAEREAGARQAEDRVVLAGGPSLAIDLGAGGTTRSLADAVFAASESLDAAGEVRAITFSLRDSAGLTLRHTYRVRPDDYVLDLEVETHGLPPEWRLNEYSLTTRSWPLRHETDHLDEARSLRATSLVGSSLHREAIGGLKRDGRRFEGNVQWVAVQTRYFLNAVVVNRGASRAALSRAETRQNPPQPGVASTPQDVAINTLVMSIPGETDPVDRFTLYFGPAQYSRLIKLQANLERLVDLGWSWIVPFSKALLSLLVWLHGLLRNYGLAIIVLATLVRVVLHPLNLISMRSMREMQKVQPEMERIREKYKNDAQAMNTAVMALYKEHKINPAGGCLPMLLQMPLFVALYSVLYNAIELRQAPFVGWIDDLSAPDVLFHVAGFPIRLLPLLMAGSGLLSQKMTPTDPRQVTTMYLMNVLMLVFFYNLPSGLVLYWTVMNLLTALQQWMVLREEDGKAAPATALATAPGAGGKRGKPNKRG